MMILADSVSFQQAGMGLGVAIMLMGALLLFLNLKEKLLPKSKDATDVRVGPLPLPIQMAERFATKEELHDVKQEVKAEIRELEKVVPETERRILMAIANTGNKMEEMVNKMASVATNGRRKLHDKTLEHSEQIAKLKEKTANTADSLREFKNEF